MVTPYQSYSEQEAGRGRASAKQLVQFTDRRARTDPILKAFEPKHAFLNDLRKHAQATAAGRDVVHEGDAVASIIWVMKGWVGGTKLLSDGRRQIVDITAPVDMIEYMGADDTVAVNDVTALTDAVVAVYPKAHLDQQCEEFPELGQIVERLRAAVRARHAQRILFLGRGDARERVAGALVELCVLADRGAASSRGTSGVHLPLRQKDIGDLIGLTAVHVCRTLRKLSRSGLVETSDHGIVVRDVGLLADICEIDLEQYTESITPCKPSPGAGPCH